MRLILWLVANALALWAAVALVGGIEVNAGDDTEYAVTVLVVGAILGAINALVRPIVRVLSIPFIVLTLGLFWFVINALMLMLAGVLAEAFGLGFDVAGFGSALLGSIVISMVLMVLNALLPLERR